MALFSFDRYSEDMIGKVLTGIGLVSGGLLLFVFNTTTPASAGAFGMLAVFILAYLCLTSMTTFVLHEVSRAVIAGGRLFGGFRTAEPLSMQRAYYYSTIVALAPVIIVSMQSVGGVGLYELALIALLVTLGCIYVTKRTT